MANLQNSHECHCLRVRQGCKSTLAADLAACVHIPSRTRLLIDTDPQGSLTLWHKLCAQDPPPEDQPLKVALPGVGDIVRGRSANGTEWAFINTAPNISASITEAIRAATLVDVPCRPGVFDLDAVRGPPASPGRCKPYAVVINGAPLRRQDTESPMVAHARKTLLGLNIPVWGGQITQRANFSLALAAGEGAKEYDADSVAAGEFGRLWAVIEKSVNASHGAGDGAAMRRVAA